MDMFVLMACLIVSAACTIVNVYYFIRTLKSRRSKKQIFEDCFRNSEVITQDMDGGARNPSPPHAIK